MGYRQQHRARVNIDGHVTLSDQGDDDIADMAPGR